MNRPDSQSQSIGKMFSCRLRIAYCLCVRPSVSCLTPHVYGNIANAVYSLIFALLICSCIFLLIMYHFARQAVRWGLFISYRFCSNMWLKLKCIRLTAFRLYHLCCIQSNEWVLDEDIHSYQRSGCELLPVDSLCLLVSHPRHEEWIQRRHFLSRLAG